MGLNNKTTLKSQADLIRYEDGEGKNTAERVGKVISEIIENTDQSLTTETNERVSQDNALQQSVTIASNTATTAYNEAKDAKTKVAAAQFTANAAKTTADAAKAVTDTKGQPGGLATLDTDGKVPATQLPGFVDDVVEFNAMVSGITPQMASSGHKSTDVGCMVVYDTDNNVFHLAVSKVAVSDNSQWGSIKRPVKTNNVVIPAIESGSIEQQINVSDYWQIENGTAVLIFSQFTYYNNWLDAASYGSATLNGRVPEAGKIYTCTSDNKTFRWSGSELITIGSDLALGHTASTAFPGDEGADVQERMEYAERNIKDLGNRIYNLGILPCDGYWDGTGKEPTQGVWLCPSEDGGVYFRSFGNTDFYNIAEEVYNSDMTYNSGYMYRIEDGIFRIVNNKFESISGSAVGNTYNATVEIPLPAGEYYSDIMAETQTHNVLLAVFNEGKASLGLTVTFAIGPSSWKTYQYIGPNTTGPQFLNVNNWIDMAGMSAGAEAIINVDALCPRKVAGYYDKSSAIDAILELQNASGIKYAKSEIGRASCRKE